MMELYGSRGSESTIPFSQRNRDHEISQARNKDSSTCSLRIRRFVRQSPRPIVYFDGSDARKESMGRRVVRFHSRYPQRECLQTIRGDSVATDWGISVYAYSFPSLSWALPAVDGWSMGIR